MPDTLARFTRIRILGVIASTELCVGGIGDRPLADRLRALAGMSVEEAAAAAEAGHESIALRGLRALEVDRSLAAEVAGVLEAHAAGGSESWAQSIENRGGPTPGSALDNLVRSIRAAKPALPKSGTDSAVPAEPLASPRPSLSGIGILVGEDESADRVLDEIESARAKPSPTAPGRNPDVCPVAQPAEAAPLQLTFDDQWDVQGDESGGPLGGAQASQWADAEGEMDTEFSDPAWDDDGDDPEDAVVEEGDESLFPDDGPDDLLVLDIEIDIDDLLDENLPDA